MQRALAIIGAIKGFTCFLFAIKGTFFRRERQRLFKRDYDFKRFVFFTKLLKKNPHLFDLNPSNKYLYLTSNSQNLGTS